MPKVSLITPLYNSKKWFSQTIDSVLSQELSDFEWLVVNDGSTDGSEALISNEADPRIRFFSQENRGVSAARNVALEHAQGDYVAFLDADDTLPTRSLQVRSSYLDGNPQIGFVDGVVRFMNKDLSVEIRRSSPSRCTVELYEKLVDLNERFFSASSYMIRRSLIEQAQFPIGVTHAEDLVFFLRVAWKSRALYSSVLEPTYIYRTGHGSAMQNLDGLEAGYLEFLNVAENECALPKRRVRATKRRIQLMMLKSWLRTGRPVRACRSFVRFS